MAKQSIHRKSWPFALKQEPSSVSMDEQLTIEIKGAIYWNSNYPSGKCKFNDITESSYIISIERFSTAVAVKRTFSYLIKNLQIRPFYGCSEENVNQIVELINLHCSETLQTISFYGFDADFFNKLTVPFKAVESVGLMSRSNNNEFRVRFK